MQAPRTGERLRRAPAVPRRRQRRPDHYTGTIRDGPESILDNRNMLRIGPAGLPGCLHAERVTDAVLSLAGA